MFNKSKKQNEGREGRETWRREEGTLHKLSQVSRLHCLQQLLWQRGEVGDNCTQVVMATAESHTFNSQQKKRYHSPERGVREGGGRVGKDMKVR